MRNTKIRQIACGVFHSFILKNNGELFAFGENEHNQLGLYNYESKHIPTLVVKDEGIQHVICSNSFYCTLVLKKSGELLAFGENFNMHFI